MAAKWKNVPLEDVAELKGGFAFKSKDYRPSGRFVLRTVNIDDNGAINRSGAAFISEALAPEYARFELESEDTLFVMVGATLGKVGFVRASDLPALLNQNMWVVRGKNGAINKRYLHYAFSYSSQKMLGWASGSARGFVRRDDFRKMTIPLPSEVRQKQIAELLGSIDDKIELNRRMNQTLETIARALFNSWFVNFDPVRAKAEGRDTGLPKHIADLFPDRFVDSELGEIPAGWTSKPLDDIADFLNGLAMQKFPAVRGEPDLPVIKIAQLKRGDVCGADRASSKLESRYVVENGDVIFSWSGSLEVAAWSGGKGALNQHLFKVTSQHYPKWFFLGWIRQHLERFRQIAADKAVTMGHIKRAHLSEAMCLVPPLPIIEQAGHVLSTILEQQLAISIQSKKLIEIRDTLLPQLLTEPRPATKVKETA